MVGAALHACGHVAAGSDLVRLWEAAHNPQRRITLPMRLCHMPAFITFGPLALSDKVVTLYCLVDYPPAFADMWKAPSRGKVVKFGVVLGGASFQVFCRTFVLLFFGVHS